VIAAIRNTTDPVQTAIEYALDHGSAPGDAKEKTGPDGLTDAQRAKRDQDMEQEFLSIMRELGPKERKEMEDQMRAMLKDTQQA
jgi:hypothetical protein